MRGDHQIDKVKYVIPLKGNWWPQIQQKMADLLQLSFAEVQVQFGSGKITIDCIPAVFCGYLSVNALAELGQ